MNRDTIFLSSQQSIALISTIFALWLTVFFEVAVESYFGYFLIITIGILHGANDIKLIGNHKNVKQKGYDLGALLKYILVVGVSTVCFILLPKFALSTFIIISAYHFGEQHWIKKVRLKSLLSRLFFTFYGLLIFGMIFYFNPNDTATIINNITEVSLTQEHFRLLTIVSAIGMLSIVLYGVKTKRFHFNWLEELFLLLIFALIFYWASLIWAFAIYFVLWHSFPSLDDQIKSLYGSNTKVNLIRYLKSSWLYWLISIIGLGMALYFFRDQKDLFHTIFFAFLAAITLPHVLVMDKLMQPKKDAK